MAVYTTLADTKTYLGETGTSNNALIGALLDAAEDMVNVFCKGRSGASLLSTEYTRERVNGGFATLTLANGPVTAVSLIEIGQTEFVTLYDSTATDEENSILVTEIDGRLIHLNTAVGAARGMFAEQRETTNRGNILVTYTAGYAATPGSLKLAIWKIVGKMFSPSMRSAGEGARRLKTGEVEIDFGSSNGAAGTYLSADIESLLKPFKQYV